MQRYRYRAFTLVELLVVIGIIAILIALLLPVLNRARAAGKGIKCLANLRDLSIAVENYKANNRGKLLLLPPGTYPPGAPGISVSASGIGYCPTLADYIDLKATGSGGLVIGSFAANSYGWNQWMTLLQQPTQIGHPGVLTTPLYCNPSSVPDTAEVVLAGDIVTTNQYGFNLGQTTNGVSTGWDGTINDPFDEGQTGSARLCRPNFHGRHGGRGSVLWLDGHASQEYAVPMPEGTAWSAGNSLGPQHPPSYYNQNHIGYLVRKPVDLSSLNAIYYFVYQKSALGSNDLNLYTDQAKSLWH